MACRASVTMPGRTEGMAAINPEAAVRTDRLAAARCRPAHDMTLSGSKVRPIDASVLTPSSKRDHACIGLSAGDAAGSP